MNVLLQLKHFIKIIRIILIMTISSQPTNQYKCIQANDKTFFLSYSSTSQLLRMQARITRLLNSSTKRFDSNQVGLSPFPRPRGSLLGNEDLEDIKELPRSHIHHLHNPCSSIREGKNGPREFQINTHTHLPLRGGRKHGIFF